MEWETFAAQCLAIDIEASENGAIYQVGARFRGASIGDVLDGRRRAPLSPDAVQQRLKSCVPSGAEYVVGHNLLAHDMPLLRAAAHRSRLFKLPAVDTLHLSPLAFPENPYHRLVKDYKLVAASLNDPGEDAALTLVLLEDAWRALAEQLAADPGRVGVYRYCFDRSRDADPAFFEALGAPKLNAKEALAAAVAAAEPFGCRSAMATTVEGALEDPGHCMALAYVLAWLQVAGSTSVLPRWVGHRFPHSRELIRRLRDTPCYDEGCTYCRRVHDPEALLAQFFGHDAYRESPATPEGTSLQKEIVRCGLGGTPLLAILPTGGGKSLCYQLPALARHLRTGALTVVISPLQALMKDQVDGLARNTGTPFAATLNGMLTPPERRDTIERVRRGDIALLYVSPEQLRNNTFRETIRQREIGCWVFDEAHCLSKWGHEFRPDYLYAGRFIQEFSQEQQRPAPPIACFTATAKPDVIVEIREFFQDTLHQELSLLAATVDRDNLRFAVRPVTAAEKVDAMHELLTERLPDADAGGAVIFRATRAAAEESAKRLQEHGWAAEAFHAGLTAPEKRRIQDDFIANAIQVICATNAFGMGIDKPNIRLVLHGDIPGSLENYIQEAGRAGRDNEQAECILLYDEQDSERQFQMGALSSLTRHDIAQILRGLRKAVRNPDQSLIITAGELLRDDDLTTSFDSDDRMAETKVKAAVSWLERADFVERNENRSFVFQGKPRFTSADEINEKLDRLNLDAGKRDLWSAVLFYLLHTPPDDGIKADELAGLAEFDRVHGKRLQVREAHAPAETATGLVMRELNDMAHAGLIDQDLLLTAYVRYKISNHAQLLFEAICALEISMLSRMREMDPDPEGWVCLSLRQLNQAMKDDGYERCTPDVLRNLLVSLSLDGQGLAAQRGSLQLRPLGQDQYRVLFRRGWEPLLRTAELRRQVADCVLATILGKVPEETPPQADLLIRFTLADLTKAIDDDLVLRSVIKDAPAAAERALTYLHEQRVIILQQGLAVFRQAMTIRVLPESKGRRYTLADFSPLDQHHKERVFQVHVMNEYAQLGLQKLSEAIGLVSEYFTRPKAEFIERFFAHDRKMLEHATTADSYRKIVDALKNADQVAAVAAKPDDNLLILAGPGSGKTRTVIHRCAYLLRVHRVSPRSILVLAFNRSAAIELRRRLADLVGADARGVTIQTYHGLAMRLTGTSLASLANRDTEAGTFDFESLIDDAIRLLTSDEAAWPGQDVDEVRERVLTGYRHILVDEYQDIDSAQYELVSAIAGRTRSDPDTRLSILAVGDDDQNVYTFRGANVRFIRQFQDDYQARIAHLLQNYRSTANILEAGNALIAHNRDRMKQNKPIRVNKSRRDDPAGGDWEARDPVGRGRVQWMPVQDDVHQAVAVVEEIRRLKAQHSELAWTDFAVLSRTHHDLHPIIAYCRDEGIPVTRPLPRGQVPPVYKFREVRRVLDDLQARASEVTHATALEEQLTQLRGEERPNAWWTMLSHIVTELKEETGDCEIAVRQAIDHIYEALLDYRTDQALGRGVHLRTIHTAKGMEFPHVLITGGGWTVRDGKDREEERRVLYVGMTRAEQTLALFERGDFAHPFKGDLQGAKLLVRDVPVAAPQEPDVLDRRFGLLTLGDLFLDQAGRMPAGHAMHRALAACQPGDRVQLVPDDRGIWIQDADGHDLARFSKSGASEWGPRLPQVVEANVFALVQRRKADVQEADYAKQCRVEEWTLPLLELVYRAGDPDRRSPSNPPP